MEIKLSNETLGNKKVFLATPMYNGDCKGGYVASVIQLISEGAKFGAQFRYQCILNESLIPRARNFLAYYFEQTDCTTLAFIDADLEFRPIEYLAMLAISGPDYPLIGGAYAKKEINWDRVKQLTNGTNPAKVTGQFVFNSIEEEQRVRIDDPIEVTEVGTGLMLIDRSVLDKMKELPEDELCFHPITGDHVKTEVGYAYFQDGIWRHDPRARTFVSEDYWFCRTWRRLGGKVYMCPWTKTTHWGTYGYQGDLEAIAKAGLAL